MEKGTTFKKEKGISRLSGGRLLVRVQPLDPKTGKRKDVSSIVTVERMRGAGRSDLMLYAREVRDALTSDCVLTGPAVDKVRFSDFAPEVNESRVDRGLIVTPQSKAKIEQVLDAWLLPQWGDMYLDKITPDDVEKWLRQLGRWVNEKKYTPHTVNTWWREFKKYMAAASAKFRVHNPCTGLHSIPTSLHRTYTAEEPNALEASELPGFFEAAWRVEPFYFAVFALGIMTGRRPCELRPLRHAGPTPDLDWKRGTLQIRRSQTIEAPTEMTKTKKDVVLYTKNSALYETLQSHVFNLVGGRKGSDLIFPPLRSYSDEPSGFMSRSALIKPLERIRAEAKIKKELSPRFMRRTYQDLCRSAGVSDTVQMAMSGHATDAMVELYSTVAETEGSSALIKMGDIAGLREAAKLTFPVTKKQKRKTALGRATT